MAGRPRKTTNIEQAVNDVGQALKALLSAYETSSTPIKADAHARVFAHLTRSLGVIQEQCGRVVTLNLVTGFSLDGPAADFLDQGQKIPSQRIVEAVAKKPPVKASHDPSGQHHLHPGNVQPAAVPVGRLSVHANEPGAGEKFFDVPTAQPKPPKDDNDVDFITD